MNESKGTEMLLGHSVDDLISNYGLLAVFFGSLVEGETVAITGGVMAHRNLLVLWQVTAVATVGAYLSDLTVFSLARRYRDNPRIQSLTARRGFQKALGALDKGPSRFALVFRFIPGMRIVGPIALAQSRIETSRFMVLAALAAIVWGIFYTVIGHSVGHVITLLIGRIERSEHILIVPAAILVVLGLVAVARHVRHRSARNKSTD